MAAHDFKGGGVSEVWYRYYIRPLSFVASSNTKHLTWNGFGDDSGIRFATVFLSDFRFYTINAGFNLAQNQGNNFAMTDQQWHCIIWHLKINGSPGTSTDLVEMWADNCGANGTSPPATPTLRMRHTNAQLRAGGDNSLLGNVWHETWDNPIPSGELYYDQMYASKAPVGFASTFS
jgi:hypothetical protein